MSYGRLALLGAVLLSAVAAQPRGVYQRPSDATGNPDWWVENHRSPCPALNTLANHGYINRDGKNLNSDMLKQAMREVFNTDDSFNNFITNGLPHTFTLADLSKHDFIEHDASLAHADMFYGLDPARVDGGLANDMLGRTDNDGMIGMNEIAETIRIRLIWCQQKWVGCDYKSNQRDVAFVEAANLIKTMGGNRNGNRISTSYVYSWLVEEKIPDGFRKSDHPVNLGDLQGLSKDLQRMVGVAN